MASGETGDRFDLAGIVRLIKQGEAVDSVLKMIADLDPTKLTEVSPEGNSLLHRFALIGNFEIVKAIWMKGARPSITQLDQSTVLHSAVRTQDESRSEDEGRAQILQLFLSCEKHGSDMKASINLRNSKGWTALKLAARKNLERCVEVLLDNGADPDIPDEEQYSALHNSVGFPAIVKLLLTKAKNINLQNGDGETPLYLAAERGLTESALTLLEYKADPNILNKEGKLLPLIKFIPHIIIN
jgi:ankyrin repeat protein